jgi:hypothetical protein
MKRAVVVAIFVAVVVAFLWTQRQTLHELHAENDALRQQLEKLAQTAADNERLSNSLTLAKNTPDDQGNELLRLRGEVGALRRQLAEAASREKNSQSPIQQQEGLTRMQQLAAQKGTAVAKAGYMKTWLSAFIQYADQNQGQFPTTFDAAASLVSQEAIKQTNFAPDQFEILYEGSVRDIANRQSVMVIREKDPWQDAGGAWVKAYGFADGHVEFHKAADGNFQDWEVEHLTPSATSQPGQ